MKCLRCGYCCIALEVVIPLRRVRAEKDMAIKHTGQMCPFLSYDEWRVASCAIHDKKFYKGSPCDSHTQIEPSHDCECRMGRHLRNSGKDGRKFLRTGDKLVCRGGTPRKERL